jgi:hypothetical protein
MKEFLYRLDGILMTILALPGLIVGLPYLIRDYKQRKVLEEQTNKIIEETIIEKPVEANANHQKIGKKRKTSKK